MTEDRKEIKDSVKAKVITMLAEQIAQETDFEKLKKELAAELLGFQEEIPNNPEIIEEQIEVEKPVVIKRKLDENDGLIPETFQEEIYRELNGFNFDYSPIETRFENGVDKLQARTGPYGPVSLLETNFIDSDETKTKEKLQSPILSSAAEIAQKIENLKKSSIINGEIVALETLYKLKTAITNDNPYLDSELNPILKLDDFEIKDKEKNLATAEPEEPIMSASTIFNQYSTVNAEEKPKSKRRIKKASSETLFGKTKKAKTTSLKVTAGKKPKKGTK